MPDGYYSGDKPNPNLRGLSRSTPRRITGDGRLHSRVQPAHRDDQGDGHLQHARLLVKKPHTAIRQYVRHYTRPGDIVLDPFCGSGGTALAALLEGRKAIAIDRSPAATFITKSHTQRAPRSVRAGQTPSPARDRLALRDAVRSLRGPGEHGIYRLQPGLPVPALPEEDRPLRLRRR